MNESDLLMDMPDSGDPGDMLPGHEQDPGDPMQDQTDPAASQEDDGGGFDLNDPQTQAYIQALAMQIGMVPRDQIQQPQPQQDMGWQDAWQDAWQDPQEVLAQQVQELQAWKQQQEVERQNAMAVSQATDVIRNTQGQEAVTAAANLFAIEPGLASAYVQGQPMIKDIVDTYIKGKQVGSVVGQLQGGARGVPTPIQAQAGGAEINPKVMEIAKELYGNNPTADQLRDVSASMKRGSK